MISALAVYYERSHQKTKLYFEFESFFSKVSTDIWPFFRSGVLFNCPLKCILQIFCYIYLLKVAHNEQTKNSC